jgi:hypothetical protein
MRSDSWKTLRRTYIGGSDARIIMGNDEAALLGLWREKRGEIEPEDLSGNLVVQLGVVTEALNRHWFERNTGQMVTAIQRRVRHPVIRFLAATLDGLVGGTGAVFESKFMLPWSFSEEAAAQKYIAQFRHQVFFLLVRLNDFGRGSASARRVGVGAPASRPCLSRTPGCSPLVNSRPAASRVRCKASIVDCFASAPFSMRVTVFAATPALLARSRTPHPIAARAILS